MKFTFTLSRWFAVPLLLAGSLCFNGCSSTSNDEAYLAATSNVTLPAAAAPPAPVFIGSGVSASAASGLVRVEAIDYTNRTCLLLRADGETARFQVGPQYPNFNQVKVGDSFLSTVSKSYVAYLVKGGATPNSITNYAMSGMPAGAQPGAVMIRNVDYNAKILVINYATRRVVLQYGKNEAMEVQAGPGVDLTVVHLNDDVFIRTTEAMAIAVTSPGP